MRILVCSAVLAALCVVKLLAENCFDYDKDLQKAIKLCEDCKKKNFTNDIELTRCVLKEILNDEGYVSEVKYINSFLEGFQKGDEKKAALKKDLEACLKNGKLPPDSKELDEVGTCVDDTLIKHCPEAKEKMKEFRENEVIKSCE